MRCSLVRLSTPTSPSAPGLPLVGAHSLQAERLTSRVGSISPTSSDTKRDFYSALPFDGAAAVVCAACIGLAGRVCYRFFVSYHLPSKKAHRKRVLKSSPLSLICTQMSPFGTKRTCRHAATMSALGAKSDDICSLR